MPRSIKTNTVINIVGQAIPVAFAFFAIPKIIHGIGTDRFGVLTLAWLVIGYFSLFDLGLGRALTQIIAHRKDRDLPEKLATTTWTAMAMMAAMGVIGAVIAGLSAPHLATHVFKVEAALQSETTATFYILAAAIPLVVISAGLVGLLTAYDRFDLINLIRTPLGISNFAAPLVVLPFSHSLVDITLLLVACRLVATVIQGLMCLQTMPAMRMYFRFDILEFTALFRFGGWMTVTNVIGPLMVYFDRFLIGAMVSVTAVAYYATPYEMATKLLILPAAIATTLFPKFSASYRQNQGATLALLIHGLETTVVILFPIILLFVLLAPQGLQIWLGVDFSEKSTEVLQWLSIGILFNSLAQLPFCLIQGAGRPDLSAKAHMVELLIYLPALWFALTRGGIQGAAGAWAFRALLDCAILHGIACRLLPGLFVYLRSVLPVFLVTCLTLASITIFDELAQRLLTGLITIFFSLLLIKKLQLTAVFTAALGNKISRVWGNP